MKIKLLLVDDEKDFIESLAERLQLRDFDVKSALNGDDAIKLVSENEFDVIILDVKMPGMDGNATLKEIKRQFPMIEVIMLTGHATVESAIDGLKSGASDYLMKPADIGDLIQKAEDAFARRQNLESKIRVAQMRKLMGSPREIIQDSEK